MTFIHHVLALFFISVLSAGAAPLPAIPLWEKDPPGALGTAEKDIPTLTTFLPTNGPPPRAATVICPGGGYARLADHEGSGYAEWLAGRESSGSFSNIASAVTVTVTQK